MSTLNDLPKLADNVTAEIKESVSKLNKVETNEKNVLPTKEDLAAEKTHFNLVQGIEKFDNNNLHSVTIEEKVVLPSNEDIKAEKTHQELQDKINNFTPEKLKKAETSEKNVLPTHADIAREKTLQLASSFDKSTLKHVEPVVTQDVVINH